MSWGTLWEVRYHFPENPDKQYVKNLRTGPEEQDAVDFLVKLMKESEREGPVILRTVVKVPPVRYLEKTCGFCGQTRLEPAPNEGKIHPSGTLSQDSHLWRTLEC